MVSTTAVDIKRHYVYSCSSGYFEQEDIKKMIDYSVDLIKSKDKHVKKICWKFDNLIVHLHFFIERQLFKYTDNSSVLAEELEHYFVNMDNQRYRINDVAFDIGNNIYVGATWTKGDCHEDCTQYDMILDWDEILGFVDE